MTTVFHIPDMACGHCQGVLSRALQAIEPGIELRFDLPTHRLEVLTMQGPLQRLQAAIEAAGYAVARVEGTGDSD